MPTFLQVVELPQRCFLREVLLWAGVQRLPIAESAVLDTELRETAVISNHCVRSELHGDYLSVSECRRAGLPLHPSIKLDLELCLRYEPDRVVALLNELGVTAEEIDLGGDDDWQPHYCDQAVDAWQPHYDRVMEYFQSQIFVALRDGRLKATGRLLGEAKLGDAVAIMKERGPKVQPTNIPADFWSLRGIDFGNSAACIGGQLYCFITCRLDEVMALFPGDRQPMGDVERLGDSFVLQNVTERPRPVASRGRPPLPWDSFHVEIASVLREGRSLRKKGSDYTIFPRVVSAERGDRSKSLGYRSEAYPVL
jgi:hypothetical protein